MNLIPDSWGSDLQEFNSCHGANDGKFCSDAFQGIPKTQTHVPRTWKDAAFVMAKGYVDDQERYNRAQGYNTGIPVFRDAAAKALIDVEKNWSKSLQVQDPANVRPEVFAAVEQGMADNQANDTFMRIVGRFGSDGVIAVPAENVRTPDSPFSDGAEAQRVGGVSVVFDSVWFDKTSAARRDAPEPGATTCASFGGMAAVLRHEYGHYVHNKLTVESRRAWSDIVAPFGTADVGRRRQYEGLKDKLTSYSADREDEAFCEAFAIWTDPKFDRRRYAPEVQPLFEFMDRKFGGKRVLERR